MILMLWVTLILRVTKNTRHLKTWHLKTWQLKNVTLNKHETSNTWHIKNTWQEKHMTVTCWKSWEGRQQQNAVPDNCRPSLGTSPAPSDTLSSRSGMSRDLSVPSQKSRDQSRVLLFAARRRDPACPCEGRCTGYMAEYWGYCQSSGLGLEGAKVIHIGIVLVE